MPADSEPRFGLAALSGRPNVGKSTLLNRLTGHKLSITSPRPQTTRHRILGICNGEGYQLVLVDTPGFNVDQRRTLNRVINRTALASIEGIDVVVLVVAAPVWCDDDTRALNVVRSAGLPIVLAINKIDLLRRRDDVLPMIDRAKDRHGFAAIVPVAAQKGDNIDRLLQVVTMLLPAGQPGFPDSELTDRGEAFRAAELIREQVFRQTGQEIPYQSAVYLERFEIDGELLRIAATLWVDKATQRGIVVGRGGERLKSIGSAARKQMEHAFGRKVYLQLWVKERRGWADNENTLHSLGYL